ncbi:MAG: YggS family pyridoxal phosphate-dependent enzyme [Bacteroidetes bacterium]|nr:MAG: YggS family pyridoxal phosphate-dependent enzyme [Bacteroidota bacterium]
MAASREKYEELIKELSASGTTLVAVSKTKPPEDVLELYNLGQRDFGENYVQELIDKHSKLPTDIRWHFIGHLQSNKVKFIAPFVHLIHGVDTLKLMREINKQGAKISRVIPVLLQVHIASEETKFGFDETELNEALSHIDELLNISIEGLMGMASFTDDQQKVRHEFISLKKLFDQSRQLISSDDRKKKFRILSMGMSSDYKIAIEEGSNLVRIGSILFGARS